ncbi:MAG: glycerol-3-phosphate 1-O-acyltransferase PlsY [Rhodoblastus sp.]|jgi:glycerol-3-phosphate acyltransferase PlsY
MNLTFLTEIAGATLIIAFVFGYLCGSIPFGLVLTKLFSTTDLRSIGSGNIGATNVLRTGRKDLAAATVLLDALKGTVAVLIAARFGPAAAGVAGLGAFIGHIYPVWLKFKGGKGVATFLGVLVALEWRAALVFAIVWLGVAFATRYSSLAALVGSLAAGLSMFALGRPALGNLVVLLILILFWKHSDNIRRLRMGVESKIGQKG